MSDEAQLSLQLIREHTTMMNRTRWFMFIAALFYLPSAYGQTVVSISPATRNAIPGSVITLNVAISGVANLHLYHVVVNFDTAMLRCEGVVNGTFFPGTFFIYSPPVLPSDTARYVSVDDALVGTQTRSGSGALFSLQFRTRQAGVSTVSLTEVVLRDGANQNITHTTANGTVTGTYPSVVYISPTFTSSNAGGHEFGFDAFQTITSGLAVVTANGTVNVLAGTYREQLYINKNVALLGAGAGSSAIVPPFGLMTQPFLPWRQERPIIGVDSLGTNVVIDGFTVDGEGSGATQQYMTGVQYFKGSGTVRNTTVKRVRATPFDGSQMFIGIMVNHDYPRSYSHTVVMENDSVYDFGKGGIVVNHPGTVGSVINCVVTGQGPTGVNAQNGIQFGFEGTGSVSLSRVSGVSYTGPSASASSILGVASGGTLDIHDNTIIESQVGINVQQAVGYPGSSSARVYGNTVSASSGGTGVTPYYGGVAWSMGGALAQGVGGREVRTASPYIVEESAYKGKSGETEATAMTLVLGGNTFTSTTPGSGAGVYLLASDTSPLTVTADSNVFNGFEVGAVTDKDAGATLTSTWRRNRFQGNNYGMADLTGVVQDARENWWNDATGPRDVKTLPATPNYNNPGGLGDSVTPFIDYNPFYTNSGMTARSYYSLNVTVSGPGSVTKSPDTTAYLFFTPVILTATPDSGYLFLGWTGDTVTTQNPLSLRMTRNRTLVATFGVAQYPLVVTTIGAGSVTRVPDLPLYNAGTPVQLTAVPALGSTFLGWLGDTATTANPITLIMNGPRNVTANFTLNSYALTIGVEGNGSVVRTPNLPSYPYGTAVGLRAIPDFGWHFVEWIGDTTATADSLYFVVTGPRNLTARFAINTYTLGVTVLGNGSVIKVPDLALYTHGTPVSLKATPIAGHHFVEWSGDTTATADSLAIVMTGNRTYTATFTINTYPVTVTIAGNGTVTRNPDQALYAHSTTVTLTAAPGGSSSFSGWTGDTVTTVNPLTLTVVGPIQLTAVFVGDKFLSLPPESLVVHNIITGRWFRPARRGRDPFPNWVNLLSEVVVQGGFRPLSSESDAAGGMRVGLSYLRDIGGSRWRADRDSAKLHAWIRLSRWKANRNQGAGYSYIQRTIEDRTGTHRGDPRGLDIQTWRPAPVQLLLRGELRSLPPKRHNNRLVGEMVALKFNIAASTLAKTPPGFGELMFTQPGNMLDGLTIRQISARVDSAMTNWQGRPFVEYDSMAAAVARINRAFTAPLDTARWLAGGQLVVNGTISLDAVPFLHFSSLPPLVLDRTTDETFDDEEAFLDDEELEQGPVALRLRQNYPNPFNPATTLNFVLQDPSVVSLRVYDLLGREVARLMDGEPLEEGEQEVDFDASGLASGVYLYRVEALPTEGAGVPVVATRKMILLK